MAEKLGRYEILEEVGQGGFATVYRAHDTELDRYVALKELRPMLLQDTEWVRRFRREARTIARLDHPHIVAIYDVYEVKEQLFIVMRLVDGPSLEELITTRGCLPWPEATVIITAVAEGLDHAHAQGILHRDLKPANILMDSKRGPMLTDFGLAKLAGESSMSITAGGGVVGTPHYIAPEVWEGQGSSRQSDIYALGCILYEMLTGEKIFKGETPPAVMMAHFKPPALPKAWPEGVPSGVADVLTTVLASRPADRYTTTGEMAEALAALVEVEPKLITPDRIPAEPTRDVASPQSAETPADHASPQELASTRPDSIHLWRRFYRHLGTYVIIIGMLAVINLLTSSYPWFLWPALAWGVGLAFQLMETVLDTKTNLEGKWRDFARHLGSYLIIISALGFINLLTSSYPWFLWPALGWGVFLAFHLGGIIFGDEKREESARHHAAAERKKAQGQPSTRKQEFVDPTIQAHLDKARAYQEQIDTLVKSTSGSIVYTRLQDLATQVSEWTQAIEALAQRVNKFQQNSLIQQDLETVPQSIEKLEAQLANETDAATRAELEKTLTNRRNQLAALQRLQNTMKRAEIKMESTLSALGTIYSQILTSSSTDHVADYHRLSDEVDEEVRTLQDHLEALEEVKLGQM